MGVSVTFDALGRAVEKNSRAVLNGNRLFPKRGLSHAYTIHTDCLTLCVPHIAVECRRSLHFH